MKKIVWFIMLLSTISLFAANGILKISCNYDNVDAYIGSEKIAVVGKNSIDLKFEKGFYTIKLMKKSNDRWYYYAEKQFLIEDNLVTKMAVSLKLKKEIVQKKKYQTSREERLEVETNERAQRLKRERHEREARLLKERQERETRLLKERQEREARLLKEDNRRDNGGFFNRRDDDRGFFFW
jgi:hypothetical protein